MKNDRGYDGNADDARGENRSWLMKAGRRSLRIIAAVAALLGPWGVKPAAAEDLRKRRLPAAVVKAIDDNRPGAEIGKLEIAKEAGITFYDIEFKGEHGEMDVAADGTVLDIATLIEMRDVPEPAAALIRRAAAGTTIRQLTRSEVRARIEKAAGTGRVARLAAPEYVYEAELAKGGEVEIAGDGTIIKGPKSLRGAFANKK